MTLSLMAIALAMASPRVSALGEGTAAAEDAKAGLGAVPLANERHGFFAPGEEVKITLCHTGVPADTLLWEVRNYVGEILESGQLPVAGTGEHVVAPANHGAGYFELHARLKESGVSIPARGTRPAGFISYGVLPGIEPLALSSSEDSRFGIQGTTFVQSGKHGAGNPFNPLYGFLGVKWVYVPMRGQNIQPQEGQPFTPKTSAEELQGRHHAMRSGSLAPFWDAHSIPAWMLKTPAPVTEPEKKGPTDFCQAWPPRDYAEYGEFVGKIARQVSATRKYCFPYMRKNYYQIHWEPDWHWRGSPEEFVQLYKTAYEAIHKNDPDAVLTGANYGVFAKGNDLLEELFAKGLGNYLDGITTHAYRLEGPLEDYMIGEMRRLVAMKRKYLKPDARIFQTEWGERYPVEYVVPKIPRQELLREMASNLRGHLIILGEGADTTFFFYAIDHEPHGFGLVYNLDFPQIPFGPTRIAPKPWAMAACAMTRLLEGTESLGRLDYLGDDAHAYLFRRGPELLAALWTSDEKNRTVRLNAGSGRVSIVDCMGQSRTVETERGEFDLAIGPIPVYVTGLSGQGGHRTCGVDGKSDGCRPVLKIRIKVKD